jgi:hypothetical protein
MVAQLQLAPSSSREVPPGGVKASKKRRKQLH